MSFLKKGYRKSQLDNRVKTKKHIKSFYKILNELDSVAKDIVKKYPKEVLGNNITEDNIAQIANEFTDITIERIESNILLAKLDVLRTANSED